MTLASATRQRERCLRIARRRRWVVAQIAGAEGLRGDVASCLPDVRVSVWCDAVVKATAFQPIGLLYLLVIATPLTAAMPQGQLIPILGLNDALTVTAAAFALVYVLLRGRGVSAPPVLGAAIWGFVIFTVAVPMAGYAVRGLEFDAAGVLNLLSPLRFVLLLWLFAVVPSSSSQRARVVLLMTLSAGFVAAVGLLQAAGAAPVTQWLQAWYPSGHGERAEVVGRVTSVIGSWNSLAMFLLTALLLIAATYQDEPRRHYRRAMMVCAALALVCLIATNLYSGILGGVLGLVLLQATDGRRLRLLIPLAVVGFIGFLLLYPTVADRAAVQFASDSVIPQTLRFRYHVWTTHFMPAIARDPVLGVHPTFDGVPFPYPESQYVYLLYRSGLVSLIGHLAWLVGVVAWLRASRRTWANVPALQWESSVALAAIILLLVFTVIGTINPVFTYTASMSYLWMLLGLVLNTRKDRQHETT